MNIRPLILCALLFPLCVYAQVPRLWGMATGGGATDQGTIFHVDADGTDFVKVFDFDDSSGWGPEGGLCLAPNGKLYGTTAHGGSGSPIAGTLFSFDPSGAGFDKILDFDITNGGGNFGNLVLCDDGLLYGAQYMGGAGGGSIYTVDPATDAYAIVHGLNTTTDGSGVTDKLQLGSDGWLYGTAHYGGAFNVGTIFRFDPITHVFETLHDFAGGGGGDTPYGGLCEAGNGWMYGTTYTGGPGLVGIMYKYDPVGDQFVTIADLDTIPGSNCWSSMVSAGPDLLLGTVAMGGNFGSGFIHSIVPSTDVFTEVFSFGSTNGGNQVGSNIVASDGMAYGLCQSGGSLGLGTVYKFNPTTNAMMILHNFDFANDGGTPRGDLVEAGTAVGMQEQEEADAITISPNPTSGPVTVTRADRTTGEARFAVRDALGRELVTGTLVGRSTLVELPGPPGQYALTITGVHVQRTVRVIKR